MSGSWPCHNDSVVTVLDMGYTSTALLISVYIGYQIVPDINFGSEKGT